MFYKNIVLSTLPIYLTALILEHAEKRPREYQIQKSIWLFSLDFSHKNCTQALQPETHEKIQCQRNCEHNL